MGVVNYSYGNGKLVSEDRDGVHSVYRFDALGNTTKLIDTTSLTVTDKFEYQAYGEVFNRTGNTATPYQYVGAYGYYSDSSGLDYLRARYYDPNLGAFLARDPVFIWPWTPYRSVLNAPTALIDPSGGLSCLECMLFCILAGNDWISCLTDVCKDACQISFGGKHWPEITIKFGGDDNTLLTVEATWRFSTKK